MNASNPLLRRSCRLPVDSHHHHHTFYFHFIPKCEGWKKQLALLHIGQDGLKLLTTTPNVRSFGAKSPPLILRHMPLLTNPFASGRMWGCSLTSCHQDVKHRATTYMYSACIAQCTMHCAMYMDSRRLYTDLHCTKM